jgi:hypothetical protein
MDLRFNLIKRCCEYIISWYIKQFKSNKPLL